MIFKETCFEWSDFPDALEVYDSETAFDITDSLTSAKILSAWKFH
jgi:hypothetical protein